MTKIRNLARFISKIKLKSPLGICLSLGLITIPFALLVFMSRSSSCTAVDNNPENPTEKTLSDFTTAAACQKAIAICSYYSRDPKNCKVKEQVVSK